jgi:hypothetical protein
MEKEIWKHVPGYEGHYQVSNLGRVKSFKRGKDKILKQSLLPNGYLQVGLCKSKVKSYYVHSLVAMVFLKHSSKGNSIVVDHIDGDKANNNLDNLQLLTNGKNISKSTSRKKLYGLPSNVYLSSCGKKYISRFNVNKKMIYLGYFNTPEEASEAYQKKLQEIESIQ